jgi:hypothetical protein
MKELLKTLIFMEFRWPWTLTLTSFQGQRSSITFQLVPSLYDKWFTSYNFFTLKSSSFKGNNSLKDHLTWNTKAQCPQLIKVFSYINFHACSISGFGGDLLIRVFHSKSNNSVKGQRSGTQGQSRTSFEMSNRMVHKVFRYVSRHRNIFLRKENNNNN